MVALAVVAITYFLPTKGNNKVYTPKMESIGFSPTDKNMDCLNSILSGVYTDGIYIITDTVRYLHFDFRKDIKYMYVFTNENELVYKVNVEEYTNGKDTSIVNGMYEVSDIKPTYVSSNDSLSSRDSLIYKYHLRPNLKFRISQNDPTSYLYVYVGQDTPENPLSLVCSAKTNSEE